ncbi:hypothetical protein [Streptomyces regalis]|uniref:hypothetical protein n=1 Tax=Streptomyces regalis TaxID=68262 RepID=UPI000A697D01|nr:hypothetical protein [Streptomyces regalis]
MGRGVPAAGRLDAVRPSPDDCPAFADAAWWTRRIDESIVQRMRAYSGYVAAGAARQAGLMAWLLFYNHQLAGRTAVAAGWLRRARRHLRGEPDGRRSSSGPSTRATSSPRWTSPANRACRSPCAAAATASPAAAPATAVPSSISA